MQEEGAFVPFAERPEWAGVTPIPSTDSGLDHVPASISYSGQYAEVMGYFRAVFLGGELSARALALTGEAIYLNPANYTAWHYRRLCVGALKQSPQEELKWSLALAHSKSCWKNTLQLDVFYIHHDQL